MIREAAAREAENGYSQPAHRGSVLGRMHEEKQIFWEEHMRVCAQEILYAAIAAGLIAEDGELEDLEKLLDDGQEFYDLLEIGGSPNDGY